MEEVVTGIRSVVRVTSDQVLKLSPMQLSGLIPMCGGLVIVLLSGLFARMFVPNERVADVQLLIKFVGLAICVIGALIVVGVLPF